MKIAALISTLLVLLLPGAAVSAAGAEADPSRGGITVTGTGAVAATPDRAGFTFGVQTEGRTASQALSANAAEAQRMIDALKRAGVRAEDIQTSQVSLSPRMSNDGTTITGYVAVNSVTATIADMARAGAVIDAAVGAGANQVFGPSLTLSDQEALYRRALRAAVADARAKARELADAAGVSVGAVTSMQESGGAPPPIPLDARAAEEMAAATPIEPGRQRIEASVTVTFALA